MPGNVDDAILRPLITSDLISLKPTLKVGGAGGIKPTTFWSRVLDLVFSTGQQLGETTAFPAKRGPACGAPAGTNGLSEACGRSSCGTNTAPLRPPSPADLTPPAQGAQGTPPTHSKRRAGGRTPGPQEETETEPSPGAGRAPPDRPRAPGAEGPTRAGRPDTRRCRPCPTPPSRRHPGRAARPSPHRTDGASGAPPQPRKTTREAHSLLGRGSAAEPRSRSSRAEPSPPRRAPPQRQEADRPRATPPPTAAAARRAAPAPSAPAPYPPRAALPRQRRRRP